MSLICIIPSCNVEANEFNIDGEWKQTYLCEDHHNLICRDLSKNMEIGNQLFYLPEQINSMITQISLLMVEYEYNSAAILKRKIENIVKSGTKK